MSNELINLQQELQVAQQQAEILQLKFELQKMQAQKASRLDDSLFSPALYQHYQSVAVTLSKSGVIPAQYKGKPEDIFVAMAMGYQLGFPVEQSLQDIAVINGRPCLWGDGLLSLALNHPECHSITEEPIIKNGVVFGFLCTVVRNGHEPHQQQFTMADAERAGLLKKQGPWQQFPARMLQMRARSYAIRDKFADALRGLRIAEIEEDDKTIIDGDFSREANATTQTEKLKSMLKIRKSQNEKVMDALESEVAGSDVEVDAIQTIQDAKRGAMVTAGDATTAVHGQGNDDEPITDEQLAEIRGIVEERGLDNERLQAMLDYFKVKKLEHLSLEKANLLLLRWRKP